MTQPVFDYSKLRGRIYEKYPSIEQFAAKVGINAATINYKLRGESPWKIPEAFVVKEALGIPSNEIETYFFTIDAGKSQQATEE